MLTTQHIPLKIAAFLRAVVFLAFSSVGHAESIINNGGFEDESPSVPKGFCIWGPEQFKIPDNFSRDTAQAHEGKASLRIFHPANTRGYIITSPFENAVKPKHGATYTFSFWARTDKPGKSATTKVGSFRSFNPWTSGPDLGFSYLDLDLTWKRFAFTFVEGTDFIAADAPCLIMAFVATEDQKEEKTLWIDDVAVEEQTGGAATATAKDFLADVKSKYPCPAVTEPFRDGDVVICAGDSITHHGAYARYLALFYATRHPEKKITIGNGGISGDRTEGLIQRFAGDIVGRKPTVITVMLGMNDVNGPAYGPGADLKILQPAIASVLSRYKENLKKIVDLARQAGIRVILMAPPPYDQTADIGSPAQFGKNDALGLLTDQLQEVAAGQKIPLIDPYHLMQYIALTKQKVSSRFTFSLDRVHPNETGHLIMAYALLKSQGFSPCVSSIKIQADLKKSAAENAQIGDMTCMDQSVSFTCKENALPYPVAGKAALALNFVPFGEELNQESLCITGLKEGRYELAIDGTKVGVVEARELASGLNLAVSGNTPQLKQALSVAAINDKRAEKETALRDALLLESDMRNAGIHLDDAAAVKKYLDAVGNWKRALVPGYWNTQAKRAEIAAEVRSLNDEMYLAAQPVAHRYEIVAAK